MPSSDHALIVAAAESLLGDAQRARHPGARRQLGKVADARAAAARRCRIVSANSHGPVGNALCGVPETPIRSEEIDTMFGVQFDDGLFPILRGSHAKSAAARLAFAVLNVNFHDFDVEQFLNGL